MRRFNWNKFKSNLLKTAKAISLVETIVAIGVSSVTLTTAAVFSTRLTVRAQENFLEESAVQLQNVIAEQLRLVEADLQINKIARVSNPASPEPFAFTIATGSNYTWKDKGTGLQSFCDTGTSDLYISLPSVSQQQNSAYQFVINLQNANSAITGVQTLPAETVDNISYTFFKLKTDQLTGAFATSNTNLYVALKKTVNSSSLGDTISINILTRYNVLNQTGQRYSKPFEIKIVKQLVCP